MCHTCTTHADRIASGELTAEVDRLRTAIKMCALPERPRRTVTVISDRTLGAMIEADPTMNLD